MNTLDTKQRSLGFQHLKASVTLRRCPVQTRSRLGGPWRRQAVIRSGMIALFLGLFVSVGAVVSAADIQVVVHPSNTISSMSKKDLARIFLRQRSRWSTGEHAKPIDQATNSETRKAFTEEVLNRSLSNVDSYWSSQVFAGKSAPPPTARSDQEVVEFVRANPGAVGYVSASASTNGVKVLTIQ